MKRAADAKIAHYFAGMPIRLHFKSDLHLARKMFHVITGLLIVYFYLAGTSRGTAVLILGSILGLDLLMEASRLKNPSFNEKFMKYCGSIMRVHEMDRFSSVPYYAFSSLIAIGIFPKPIAILAILYLSCGDPIASSAGILYGHRGPRFSNGKTLIGTTAGVLACALMTFFYLKSLNISSDSTVLVASVIGGLAGGLAELLPFEIDDNFTIPIISGFIVWLAFLILGI